ncbi:hypothetical protein HF086_000682, partial [Spodoptera exigua]
MGVVGTASYEPVPLPTDSKDLPSMHEDYQETGRGIYVVCLLLNSGEVNGQDILKDNLLEPLINELYLLYKDAYETEKTYVTRRFFTNFNHYTLHVEKLKEVNGWKHHNLKIESKAPWGEPVIYINNPVECRMPNAFITKEQFKKTMLDRIEKQKKEFSKDTIDLIRANKYFESHRPLPSYINENMNENIDQSIDKLNDEIVGVIGSHLKRHREVTNKKSTDTLMITSVSLKNGKINTNNRITSPYDYKNTVSISSRRSTPALKYTKEIKLKAKSKTASSPIHIKTPKKPNNLFKSYLVNPKTIKPNFNTTTAKNPASRKETKPVNKKLSSNLKLVFIPERNKSIAKINPHKITTSIKKRAPKYNNTYVTVHHITGSKNLSSNLKLVSIHEQNKAIAKMNSHKITNSTKKRAPKHTNTYDTVHHTGSKATVTKTNRTMEATTKMVARDIIVIANETIKETTVKEPKVTTINIETIKKPEVDVTVHNTESSPTVTKSNQTVEVTTKMILSDTENLENKTVNKDSIDETTVTKLKINTTKTENVADDATVQHTEAITAEISTAPTMKVTNNTVVSDTTVAETKTTVTKTTTTRRRQF